MAPATDDDIITGILGNEGGYVNHPLDAGGPTNHGITQYTLAGWRGHEVTAVDVAALQESEARAIYRALYIHAPRFDQIPDMALRELVVDAGVMSGTKRAAMWLQEAVLVPEDGIVGKQTLAAIQAHGAPGTYLRFCAARLRSLGHLITAQPSQAVFAEGWLRRMAVFVETAPLS